MLATTFTLGHTEVPGVTTTRYPAEEGVTR